MRLYPKIPFALVMGVCQEELTRIREAIDVRDLGESCVKVSGDKTVAKVLYALEDKICNG